MSRLHAHRLAREGLENELSKPRHSSQGEESNPPPRRDTKGPRDALRTGARDVAGLSETGRLTASIASQKKTANSGKSIFCHANDAIELKFSPLGRQRRVGVGRRGGGINDPLEPEDRSSRSLHSCGPARHLLQSEISKARCSLARNGRVR